MPYKRIRAGGGLGDSLYLQSIVRHLANKGEMLEVCSNWPDVFKPLQGKITIAEFSRQDIQINAHYTMRKNLKTKQFEDCCITAGLEPSKVEMKLDWKTESNSFVKTIEDVDKPNLAVLIYRDPMGRADKFGHELLPNKKVMNNIIGILKEKYNIVQIGSGKSLFDYNGIDLDFANKTTVSEMIDVVSKCDAVFGYCSFLVPLAESLGKRGLYVWAAKGLESQTTFINTITPEKILYKDNSHYVVDSWDEKRIEDNLYGLL